MNIENALKIEGAMDPPELEWLAEQAAKHRRIVEIGSWQGRSTMVLADNVDGIVFAVDHWRGSEEHQEMLKDKPKNYIYDIFRRNMRHHLESATVCMLRMSSMEAAEKMKGHPVDMVFIDASHDTDSVIADITAWKSLIITGGLLCGHDYGYPPVAKAVHDCLRNVSSSGSIWFTEIE